MGYEKFRQTRLIVGFLVSAVIVVASITVTAAALKFYLNDDYTHIYYAPCPTE